MNIELGCEFTATTRWGERINWRVVRGGYCYKLEVTRDNKIYRIEVADTMDLQFNLFALLQEMKDGRLVS